MKRIKARLVGGPADGREEDIPMGCFTYIIPAAVMIDLDAGEDAVGDRQEIYELVPSSLGDEVAQYRYKGPRERTFKQLREEDEALQRDLWAMAERFLRS